MARAWTIDLERCHRTLRTWTEYGRRLDEQRVVPSWQAVTPLIEAGKNLLDLLHQEFKELVKESDKCLHPLTDPFHLDFSSHRSFTGTREERYSDWLAWILEQITAKPFREKHPEWLFELLKVSYAQDLANRCQEVAPSIEREWRHKREMLAESGHETQVGRTDLLIRYRDRGVLIHIEVKVTDADSAGLETASGKTSGDVRSLREKFRDDIQHHAILVTGAERNTIDEWKKHDPPVHILTWQEVSLGLRRIVQAGDLQHREPLLAALILGFAGTVEQTLLGLSSVASAPLSFNSATTDYLRRVVSHGEEAIA